ncbi:MAG: sterol desaturase family protein [Myxococcales bacterium]|nr:sterol desaturase family protein [Myxococcales bacterium]
MRAPDATALRELAVWSRDVVIGLARQFNSPGVAVYWLYLLGALTLGALVYAARRRSARGLLGYLVPARVWLHRSTRNDLLIFVGNTLLYSFLLYGPLQWISRAVGQRTWLALHTYAGPCAAPWSGAWAMLLYSLVAFLVADLAFYLYHRVMHRVPALWEFHKVHHSAPVLQPLTVLRQHPVDVVLHGALAGLMLAPVHGLAGWLGGGGLDLWTVRGVNGLLFFALLLGFNLQHSHVWLSFGPLDRWLISPATHQLHHSSDPAHHDRNYGNMLALWDRALGTLVLPRAVTRAGAPPQLRFGLGPEGGAWEREYGSAWRLYLWPFVQLARRLATGARALARRVRS